MIDVGSCSSVVRPGLDVDKSWTRFALFMCNEDTAELSQSFPGCNVPLEILWYSKKKSELRTCPSLTIPIG